MILEEGNYTHHLEKIDIDLTFTNMVFTSGEIMFKKRQTHTLVGGVSPMWWSLCYDPRSTLVHEAEPAVPS